MTDSTILQTPTPLVDIDTLERNLNRMAAYAAEHGLGLRPHVKTHKSPRVARAQVERGAVGLTCATPREAEVMATCHDDLLLAYPPIGGGRVERMLDLPAPVRPMVALDSAEAVLHLAPAAREAGRTVRVLVELDLGMRRVGVATPQEAVSLARMVMDTTGVEFVGVAFYPGHLKSPGEEREEGLARLGRDLGAILDALTTAALPARIVSGGSTPTAWDTHRISGVTEFRPGTYVYNDRTTVAAGACRLEDCALTVLATVVSTAVSGQAVIDAGTKALGREPMGADPSLGYGEILGHPEVVVSRMSEEHGVLDLSRTAWRPTIGEQVRVLPNHVCIAVHLHDFVHGVRGESLEVSWPIEARGRLPG